jgi:hypothetical protein
MLGSSRKRTDICGIWQAAPVLSTGRHALREPGLIRTIRQAGD